MEPVFKHGHARLWRRMPTPEEVRLLALNMEDADAEELSDLGYLPLPGLERCLGVSSDTFVLGLPMAGPLLAIGGLTEFRPGTRHRSAWMLTSTWARFYPVAKVRAAKWVLGLMRRESAASGLEVEVGAAHLPGAALASSLGFEPISTRMLWRM